MSVLEDTLSTVKAASDAVHATIGMLEKHAERLDAQYDALLAHQKRINAQGPVPPPNPDGKKE